MVIIELCTEILSCLRGACNSLVSPMRVTVDAMLTCVLHLKEVCFAFIPNRWVETRGGKANQRGSRSSIVVASSSCPPPHPFNTAGILPSPGISRYFNLLFVTVAVSSSPLCYILYTLYIYIVPHRSCPSLLLPSTYKSHATSSSLSTCVTSV